MSLFELHNHKCPTCNRIYECNGIGNDCRPLPAEMHECHNCAYDYDIQYALGYADGYNAAMKEMQRLISLT